MTARVVIGVMGAGEDARETDIALAEELGELLACEGWIVLTGGRDAGVMAAAARGAKRVDGSVTIGILPGAAGGTAPHIDIAIYTGMGEARNVINILSSRAVITCGFINPGTAIEAALAIKNRRPLILLRPNSEAEAFFRGALVARTAEEAVGFVRRALAMASASLERSAE